MSKETKTNAMRMLDRKKIPYRIIQYECDEFIDGLHTAEKQELLWSSPSRLWWTRGKKRPVLCAGDSHSRGNQSEETPPGWPGKSPWK